MASINLNCLLKGPISKYTLTGVRASVCELVCVWGGGNGAEGDKIQPLTQSYSTWHMAFLNKDKMLPSKFSWTRLDEENNKLQRYKDMRGFSMFQVLTSKLEKISYNLCK